MLMRRTPAPDMTGCILLLYAATLFFAVLRSLYMASNTAQAVLQASIYGALLLLCAGVAAALFQRKAWARPAGMLMSVASFVCAVSGFHVPETAQVPAGILGLLGLVLLLFSGREFGQRSRAA